MKKTAKKAPKAKKAAPKTERRSPGPAAKKAAPKRSSPRADLGAPVEGFFKKQPPQLRAILDELRRMVEEAAPDASASLKWGMPAYSVGGALMCMLTGHKAHVNLVLSGPADAFADPKGLLAGDGKSGRHLKLTSIDELPRAAVRAWLKTAAKRARSP